MLQYQQNSQESPSDTQVEINEIIGNENYNICKKFLKNHKPTAQKSIKNKEREDAYLADYSKLVSYGLMLKSTVNNVDEIESLAKIEISNMLK